MKTCKKTGYQYRTIKKVKVNEKWRRIADRLELLMYAVVLFAIMMFLNRYYIITETSRQLTGELTNLTESIKEINKGGN